MRDPSSAQARALPDLVAGPEAFDSALGFVRRHFALAVITTVLAYGAWTIHALLTAPEFVATAKVLVDPNAAAQLANKQQQAALPDTDELPTQVDLLKSDNVARKVINDLNLMQDEELSRQEPLSRALSTMTGFIESIRDGDLPAPLFKTILLVRPYLKQSADRSAEAMRRTLVAFQKRLKIQPVPSSHIINVSFRSSNPKRAAEIANAVASAVSGVELNADAEATQKANAWSQSRMLELRAQMEKAQKELVEFKGTNTVASQLILRDLAARSQTLRNAYDAFLRRDVDSTRRDSFPVAKSRLVAAAAAPLENNNSNVALALVVVTLVGASAGLGLGALRDARDRTFRTRDQLKAVLGVDCIALVPKLKRRNKLRHGCYGRGSSKLFSGNNQFIEALRSIELAAEGTGHGPTSINTIIGVTSALPGEGKSTLAAALAFHMRQRVERVLLVDCDMRNPYLSRVISPKASCGLSELMQGAVSRDDAVLNGHTENVNFLPARSKVNRHKVPAVVDSHSMQDAFASLRRQYDLIFLDLPPLAPVVDARAIVDLIDGYLLVVEWGQTKIDVVQHALANAKPLNDKLIGVVLNKVNLSRLTRYDRHLTEYYSPEYFKGRRGL